MDKTMKMYSKMFYIATLVLLFGCNNNDYNEAPGDLDKGDTVIEGPTNSTSYNIFADIPAEIRQLQIPTGGVLRVSQKLGQQDVTNMTIKGSEAVYVVPSISDGNYTIDITINLDVVGANSVVLAYASQQISISTGSREVRVPAAIFTFPDDDNDQYTNIFEILKGTNPTDPSDFPSPQSPIVTSGSLYYSNYTNDSVDIRWPEVVKVNADSILQYSLYYSTQNNLNTVGEILTNGIAYGQPTNRNTITVSGLPDYRNYTWNVIVRDQDGNTGIYIANKFGAVLDNQFGDNGVVIEQFAMDTATGFSIVEDMNGSYVIAGVVKDFSVSRQVGFVARYLKNGVLDSTWNTVGYYILGGDTSMYGAAIDENGRVIVVGSDRKILSVWRFNTDGTLDKSFNSVGQALFDKFFKSEGFRIAIDGFGKIVVSGVTSSNDYIIHSTIWRFNIDGSLDASFNGVGYVREGLPSGSAKIVFDKEGNILLIGFINNVQKSDYIIRVDPYRTMAVWRYLPTGMLDSGFGSNGLMLIGSVGASNLSTAAGEIVATDSGWLIAGYEWDSIIPDSSNMMIWKITTDGQLDTSFNSEGIASFSSLGNANDFGYTVGVDLKNRILVTGQSAKNMTIWRYGMDGKLDSSFGENAGFISFTSFTDGEYSTARSMTIDSNDNITILGAATLGALSSSPSSLHYSGFAIWKFIN